MQINVWSGFSKRKNSTKQPTAGTTINCLLKEECSILAPKFILNTLDFSINYVQAFGNYYYADVTNLDGNRSEISCTIDYLATFKSQIQSTSCFVEYAALSSDVTITDPRNKPTSLVTATPTALSLTGVSFNTVGGYIVGVLSDAANGASGVVDYYAMTNAQMIAFCQELYSQNILDRIKDQFTNAMDSLVSCIWLPMTGIGGGSTAIHIGREILTATGGRISGRLQSFSSGLVTLGFSSISGGAGSAMTYLEKAPYATGEIYLPFVGFVPLDMDLAAYTKSVQLDGWVDILTGDIVYKLKYGAIWAATYNGNLATKLPVTAASYDGIGVASGTITAIGGLAAAVAAIASGGSAIPGIVAMGAGITGAAKSAELHTMINGGNSSAVGASLGTTPYAVIYQNDPTMTAPASIRTTQGLPYFKVATLSSLSGYIQCSGASVSIPGDGSEQDAVNGYLNSGFYLE